MVVVMAVVMAISRVAIPMSVMVMIVVAIRVW
jgi:hypothetical protein